MWTPSLLALGLFSLLQSTVDGLALPVTEVHRRAINVQSQHELASLICPNSTIYAPTSSNWTELTLRYMQNISPQIELSVHPGCETDIPKIVRQIDLNRQSLY